MGNEPPKKQKQQYQPRLEKQKLEIACIKVIGHLEIQRDRRISQGAQKEKALIQMMNAPQRSKVEEVHKASSIVTDMFYIEGCNIVIRFCGIIKDRSLVICESVGKPENIEQLMPYIESVIWAAKYLNLNAMQEFQGLIMNFFGAQGIDVTQSDKVDKELKKCFETVMPTPIDINDYILKLMQKTGMTLQQINAVGHEFTDQPIQPPQQPGQQPGQGPQEGGSGGFNQPPNPQPGVGGYFPNQQQQSQQVDPYGRVINVNVNVVPGQQGQQQFNLPPGGQQFNQTPSQFNQQQQQPPASNYPQQQGGFNQPPSGFNNQQQQQPSNQGGFQQPPSTFNQPPQQGGGFNQPPQQSGGFNQPPQQQQQSGGFNQPPASAGYPGLESQNFGQAGQQQQNNSSNPSINNPFGGNNSSQGSSNLQNQFNQLPPPQQQQPVQFQAPQVQAGFNQPPQQQQQNQQPSQVNQPPQQGQAGDIDSLEERLKRLREGV